MRIAQLVAGYSLAEADLLRKAIGKKKREIMAAEGEKFIRKCGRARHAEEEGAGALVADRALRALRVQQVARRGLRARGLQDRVPEGALSGRLPRGQPLGRDRLDRRHRQGPRRLPGVGDPGAAAGHQRVAAELRGGRRVDPLRPRRDQGRRRGGGAGRSSRSGGRGPFASFTDFVDAAGFAPRQQAHARRAHRGRRLRLARQEPRDAGRRRRSGCSRRAARRREEVELGQSNLFGGGAARTTGRRATTFPELPEWPLDERLKGEKDTLGFYVTGHPADAVRRGDRALRRGAGSRSSPARVEQSVRVAGVLGNLKKQKIKKGVNEGKTMLKAALEDTSGSVPRRHLREPLREGPGLGARRPARCWSRPWCASPAARSSSRSRTSRRSRASGSGARGSSRSASTSPTPTRTCSPAAGAAALASRARRPSRSGSCGPESSRRR